MSVPARSRPSPMRRTLVVFTLAFGLALTACGSSADPTSPPSAAAPTATPSSGATTPIAAATATPAPTPVVTPTPAPSLTALSLLWQKGGPVTDATSTVASAIDPATGDVWVAVPFENKYWILSPDGKYLESWGQAGTGDGQFDFSDHAQHPDGWGAIAFAPDGSFYVGDTGNDRVQEFDAHRKFVRQWGTFGTGDGQFTQVTSLATDGHVVYVGDGDRYDIQAFDTSGKFIRSFGADGGFQILALGPHGGIHATNPQNPVGATFAMAVFGPDGAVQSTTDLSRFGGWPVAVTVDAVGNSYVSIEVGHYPFTALGIVVIDSSGRITGALDGGGDALTVTPAGDALYVSRGVQLDTTQWTNVRKYALPKP
jgi:hypothetical protein